MPQVNNFKGAKDAFGSQFLFVVPWLCYFREVAACTYMWKEYMLVEAAYLRTEGQQSGEGGRKEAGMGLEFQYSPQDHAPPPITQLSSSRPHPRHLPAPS